MRKSLLSMLKALSYRLGLSCFLTSEELRVAGFKANNGFHDQRTALHWIKKHIGGFGGDPEEITTIGESGGGCMCCSSFSLSSINSYSVRHNVLVLQRAFDETMYKYWGSAFVVGSRPTGGCRTIIQESHTGSRAVS